MGCGLFFILGENSCSQYISFPIGLSERSLTIWKRFLTGEEGQGSRSNYYPSIPTWTLSASTSTTRRPQPHELPPFFHSSCSFPQI